MRFAAGAIISVKLVRTASPPLTPDISSLRIFLDGTPSNGAPRFLLRHLEMATQYCAGVAQWPNLRLVRFHQAHSNVSDGSTRAGSRFPFSRGSSPVRGWIPFAASPYLSRRPHTNTCIQYPTALASSRRPSPRRRSSLAQAC